MYNYFTKHWCVSIGVFFVLISSFSGTLSTKNVPKIPKTRPKCGNFPLISSNFLFSPLKNRGEANQVN